MKEKLQALVKEMHEGGLLMAEAALEFKRRYVLEVLNDRNVRGNQCKAARELGMHRNTLSRTIKELNLVKGTGKHPLWMTTAELAQTKRPVTNVRNEQAMAAGA